MLDGSNEDVNPDRRRFLGVAAMTIAASRLGLIGAVIGSQTRRSVRSSRSMPAC